MIIRVIFFFVGNVCPPRYDEDGNELPELEVEDPYKNDYQQVIMARC